MPGLITHFIFAQSVRKNLNDRYKEIIKKYDAVFNIGAQGPDLFFYYFPGLVKKNVKGLGQILHKKKVGLFLNTLIKEVDAIEDKQSREIGIAYLLGYITHYELDYKTHKYIYYRTGFKIEGNPILSARNSVLHKILEENIDLILIETLTVPSKNRRSIWEAINAGDEEKKVIGNLLQRCIYEVHSRNVSSSEMEKAVSYLKNVTKYLDNSKKKRRYNNKKLKEDLTIDNKIKYEISCIEKKNNSDYFNLGKNIWYSPYDLEEKHRESFLDLYNESLHSAIKTINLINTYCTTDICSKNMEKQLGNYSLASGLDCDSDRKFKYYSLKKLKKK